jgi:hypothetical protein
MLEELDGERDGRFHRELLVLHWLIVEILVLRWVLYSLGHQVTVVWEHRQPRHDLMYHMSTPWYRDQSWWHGRGVANTYLNHSFFGATSSPMTGAIRGGASGCSFAS